MLRLKNISKSYKSKVILEGLSVSFKDNSISVIVGPSGEGKTTLFRIISGLESPDYGEVLIGENDDVGMVFQDYQLYPHLNVLNNLVLPQRVVKKKSKKQSVVNALNVLKQMNINYLQKEFVSNISGGEAQRVSIARTLVMDKNIILFDEPTSALDYTNVMSLIELLKELKKSTTILIITHDMLFAEQIADEMFKIEDKKIKKSN